MDGRYVDREKLVKLLKDLFGAGNFQIKVGFFAPELHHWFIYQQNVGH